MRAVSRLLQSEAEPAVVINAEMGTSKTTIAISASPVLHAKGHRRTLVIAPPHLGYK